MADRPAQYPDWATQDVVDPISQQYNVVEPPISKKTDGWFLGEKPNRQWWNWFNRTVNDWIQYLDGQQSQSVTTDDAGIALFPLDNALIEISAVDLDDASSVYKATGIKVAGQPPQFAPASIVSNNLSLGVGTVGGNQPITGGTNIVVTGFSRVIS